MAGPLGASYPTAASSVRELIARSMAEKVEGTYSKLIRFPGVLEALRLG